MTETATDAADLAVKKDELRRQLRAVRAGLPRELVVARGDQAATQLLRALPPSDLLPPGSVVALFAGIEAEGELDPRAVDPALRARGVTPVYPRVARRKPPLLSFHRVSAPEALVRGPLGVPTPSPDSIEVPLTEIDVFVVPGIAFSPSGARLGFGAGYYDATLAAAPRALRVGFTHPEQLVDEVPESTRDERVDQLVFPTLTLSCPPRLQHRARGAAVSGVKP